jgi:hypothetical protein
MNPNQITLKILSAIVLSRFSINQLETAGTEPRDAASRTMLRPSKPLRNRFGSFSLLGSQASD